MNPDHKNSEIEKPIDEFSRKEVIRNISEQEEKLAREALGIHETGQVEPVSAPSFESIIESKNKGQSVTVAKTEIFKLVYSPYEKVITCNNKDYSIAKCFEANPNSLKQFSGRNKMFVKAKIITQGENVIEFRIVKNIPNKNW